MPLVHESTVTGGRRRPRAVIHFEASNRPVHRRGVQMGVEITEQLNPAERGRVRCVEIEPIFLNGDSRDRDDSQPPADDVAVPVAHLAALIADLLYFLPDHDREEFFATAADHYRRIVSERTGLPLREAGDTAGIRSDLAAYGNAAIRRPDGRVSSISSFTIPPSEPAYESPPPPPPAPVDLHGDRPIDHTSLE